MITHMKSSLQDFGADLKTNAARQRLGTSSLALTIPLPAGLA